VRSNGVRLIHKSPIRKRDFGGSKPAEQNQNQHDNEYEADPAATVVAGALEGAASEHAKASK